MKKLKNNTRMWTGVTLLVVLAFNYGIIGLPLYRRAASLNDRATVILMDKIKSGKVLKGSDDEYILDVFRREKAAVEGKLLIVNGAAISLAIIICSWVAFGLVMRRKS